MSSIYRKGRDGYYYYQTYIYNPDTGKNNKRIFYSLGTKDQVEAENKQIILDIKHKKQKTKPKKNKTLYHLLIYRKTIAIVLVTVFAMIFIIHIFHSNNLKQQNISDIVRLPIQKDRIIEKITEKHVIADTNNLSVLSNTQMDISPEVSKHDQIIEIEKLKPTIPKYTIIRVENLSGVFNQGKVYLTLDKSSSNESMRLLCAMLKENYKEFSNIIICIYADNLTGNILAMGATKSQLSIIEQNKAWLAMYSYNIVEGEYFDDNPGGYLGTD